MSLRAPQLSEHFFFIADDIVHIIETSGELRHAIRTINFEWQKTEADDKYEWKHLGGACVLQWYLSDDDDGGDFSLSPFFLLQPIIIIKHFFF